MKPDIYFVWSPAFKMHHTAYESKELAIEEAKRMSQSETGTLFIVLSIRMELFWLFNDITIHYINDEVRKLLEEPTEK